MAIIRSLSSATLDTPTPTAPNAPRHHLRAVDRDEVIDVAEFLPPGATWLPAPPHTLPTLPGQPPMVGYLVLIPADSPHLVRSAPVAPVLPAEAEPLVRIDTVQRTAQLNGEELDLTYLEFELLAHLVAHPNRVHTPTRPAGHHGVGLRTCGRRPYRRRPHRAAAPQAGRRAPQGHPDRAPGGVQVHAADRALTVC